MKNVATVILGGGQGSRLWPLTRDRAKPAVPVAGKFRLIDVPISNSLKAGIDRIYVLTQFNSASLHRHMAQTYRFDAFSKGFVNILAAEQNVGNTDWYQGTADAVRQNLQRLIDLGSSDTLILSGDQLYFMDLEGFVTEHRSRDADLTIAVKPVSPEEATSLGIMEVDGDGRIVEFVEKPQDPEVIARLTLDQEKIDRLGLKAEPGTLLASMGIYVFRTGVMADLLSASSATDFGKEVIPSAIGERRVFAFPHYGYWRDIGTIKSFHQANLELTIPLPELNLYNPDFPIYTHPRFLPGSKINKCEVTQSILAEGTIVSAASIRNSIVGIRGIVRSGTVLESSFFMGATRFERRETAREPGCLLGIGHNCRIKGAIIDIDACIGDGCELVNEAGVQEAEAENYVIRDGVIVVPRGAIVPPGTKV